MTKHDFINSVISRFSYYTKDDDKGSIYDTYSRVLTNKIDYSKLWDKFCNEYSSKTPPTGVELKNLAKSCYLENVADTSSKWLHVKVFDPRYKSVRNMDCFPIGTTNEEIINTYEHLFKCTGWKVIETR